MTSTETKERKKDGNDEHVPAEERAAVSTAKDCASMHACMHACMRACGGVCAGGEQCVAVSS